MLCRTQHTADCASHKAQDAFLGHIIIFDTHDPNKHGTNCLSNACGNRFKKRTFESYVQLVASRRFKTQKLQLSIAVGAILSKGRV